MSTANNEAEHLELAMLNALELFHYETRFREKVFVIALDTDILLSDIIMDLRVIDASDIHVILFCQERAGLGTELESWNLRGTKFKYYPHNLGKDVSKSFNAIMRRDLRSGYTPVLGLKTERLFPNLNQNLAAEDKPKVAREFALQALDTAQDFEARKVFFLSRYPGLIVDGRFRSHPTELEIASYLNGEHEINIGKEQLEFIREQFVNRGIEIALLEGVSGSLFQEVFTHRGRGTLFTRDYPNVIRRGRAEDVTDLSLLMRPGVSNGLLLPMNEDEIAKNVDSFFVFTVNHVIVASSRLIEYGESCELAKFTTLPRFQSRGRARKLALAMIEEAERLGKTYVFSLSIEPKVWKFFEALGFTEVPRESLPQEWQLTYDFSRASKAFRLDLR